jgi:hypothetical protein
MNLNKNDKIILIAGITILIIAGVGIALYTSPDEEGVKVLDTEQKYYNYNWMKDIKDEIIEDNIYVEKSSTYKNNDLSIDSPPSSVITNIEIQIIWEDDYTYGIFRTRGEDTLTVTITDEKGESKTESATSGENLTFQFNSNYKVPISDSIPADNKLDAETNLENLFKDQNIFDFDIEVNVETGERLFRPLKFLRDQGNDFQIKAKYTYYYFDIEEQIEDNENDENKTTNDDGSNIGIGNFYKNLCYGKSMI